MATKASEWKGARPTGNQEVELPSGNTALVQQLQPEAFLSSGVIPDALSGMITQAIQSKKGLPPQAMNDISKDPKKLMAALEMMDRVLCYVVIEPHVEMPPKCKIAMNGEPCESYLDVPQHTDPKHPNHHSFVEGDRTPDVLYADAVDTNDKMFIFNYAVGGTKNIESFREQLSGNVGAISERKAVASKTKRSGKRQ
jgi:hypothetical protein